jgi:Pyruvate/2-oxoacid:ferredoxin oxidoreductase delta subunit
MEELYERLRRRLDDMATGFPATESGVELRILKRLFTAEEAALFLDLSPLLESPEAVAARLGRDLGETAAALEAMARKGLLFRRRTADQVRYAAVPYVVGLFEFQLRRMDAPFARDNEEYFRAGFGRTMQGFRTPVMRAVPVNARIAADWPVAPYEDVAAILDAQERIAVSPCVCRVAAERAGRDGCGKPQENCFSFGAHADYYVENGLGRYIGREEARAIVAANERAGLVMQPFNSQKAGGMCSCCGDCCGMLRSLKLQPKPAEAVKSNYFAAVDAGRCTGCETCLARCQMEAIALADAVAAVDRDRCIGCGLCVTTCPTEALRLVRKQAAELYQPPRTAMETYLRIAQERGKL